VFEPAEDIRGCTGFRKEDRGKGGAQLACRRRNRAEVPAVRQNSDVRFYDVQSMIFEEKQREERRGPRAIYRRGRLGGVARVSDGDRRLGGVPCGKRRVARGG
jgi:hypothetical protein